MITLGPRPAVGRFPTRPCGLPGLALGLGLALSAGAPARAGGPGTTGAQFLKIETDARATGLGGAYGAVGAGAAAIFWNPAGLASLKGREAAIGFNKHFQDIHVGHAAVAADWRASKIAVGGVYLNVPDIERRGLSDQAGIVPSQGTFNARDLAVSVATAKREAFPNVLDGLDGGLAIKVIHSRIDDKSAVSTALDAGLLYRPSGTLRLSLVMQNLGPDLKFVDVGDPLPLKLSAGGAWNLSPRLLLAAEGHEYVRDQQFFAALGGEYWFRDALALRAGYRFGEDTGNLGAAAGVRAGFGLRVAGLGLDYAFMPLGDLGAAHRFSFWFRF